MGGGLKSLGAGIYDGVTGLTLITLTLFLISLTRNLILSLTLKECTHYPFLTLTRSLTLTLILTGFQYTTASQVPSPLPVAVAVAAAVAVAVAVSVPIATLIATVVDIAV